MSWSLCGKLLRIASRYGWFDVLPVGLRTSVGKVLLLHSTFLLSGMFDVVDLVSSVQEPKSQWYEGGQLVDLKPPNGSPFVVHFESCHCLLLFLGSAVSSADGRYIRQFPLHSVSFNLLLGNLWMPTGTNGCFCLVTRRGRSLVSIVLPWSKGWRSCIPTRSRELAWTLWDRVEERVSRAQAGVRGRSLTRSH